MGYALKVWALFENQLLAFFFGLRVVVFQVGFRFGKEDGIERALALGVGQFGGRLHRRRERAFGGFGVEVGAEGIRNAPELFARVFEHLLAPARIQQLKCLEKLLQPRQF